MHKICTFLLVLFCGFASQAQVNQAAQDTVKTGFSIGKVQMKNPKSILSAYTGIFTPILLMDSLSIILLY